MGVGGEREERARAAQQPREGPENNGKEVSTLSLPTLLGCAHLIHSLLLTTGHGCLASLEIIRLLWYTLSFWTDLIPPPSFSSWHAGGMGTRHI